MRGGNAPGEDAEEMATQLTAGTGQFDGASTVMYESALGATNGVSQVAGGVYGEPRGIVEGGGGVPPLSPGTLGEKFFHEFEEIEDTDVDIIHLESPRKQGPSANRWLKTVHWLDMTLGQLSLFGIWRFAAIAIPMSVQWGTGSVSVANFLVAYAVCMVVVSWPLFVFETAVAQATAGEVTKSFACLSLKARVSSLNWVVSLMFMLITGSLASYCLIFSWEASNRWGRYTSPGIQAKEALDLYVGRRCVAFDDYVPHLSPWLCGPAGKRLDITCYDETQCHLFMGSGRCLAVPWAPASEFLFTSVEEYDPILDQDYPHYCSARFLHDVTTNNAKAVMNALGKYRDWGGNLRPRLIVAFLSVFAVAALVCAVDALGSYGTWFGQMCRVTASLLRIGMGLTGLLALALLTLMSLVWWKASKAYDYDWTRALVTLDGRHLMRPDVWALALLQALLTLRVATGNNELVASKYRLTSSNTKGSLILRCFLAAATQATAAGLVLYMCWFAYGATARKVNFDGNPEDMYATIRFDVRNMAYGTLFTSVQTMLDNGPELDGSTPRSVQWGRFFWFAMFLLGVNGVHHAIDTVAGAFTLSKLNWRFGIHRVAWALAVSLLAFVWSIPQWFGLSWGFTVTYHHFLTNWAYPVIVLYEAINIGWMVGHEARSRHWGDLFFLVQIALFLAGALVACFTVVTLWRHAPLWKPLTGLAVGVLVMAVSFVAPLPFVHTHDAYSRKHTFAQTAEILALGSSNHLRKELNSRCCHTHNVVFKIHLPLILAVRYVAPVASLFTFANMSSSFANLWHFSPYTPFNVNYVDRFMELQTLMKKNDLIRAPGWLVGFIAAYAISMLAVPPVFYVFPHAIDWLIPLDANENFFETKEATEKFASTTKALADARTPLPTRLDDQPDFTNL